MNPNPEQLLFQFYKKSFSIIFRNRIQFNAIEASDSSNFEDYVQTHCSKEVAIFVKRKLLTQYQENVSPSVKTTPLLNYLHNCTTAMPVSVLDFGCGCGFIAKYLALHLNTVEQMWGVDNDTSILPILDNEAPRRKRTGYWKTIINSITVSLIGCIGVAN